MSATLPIVSTTPAAADEALAAAERALAAHDLPRGLEAAQRAWDLTAAATSTHASRLHGRAGWLLAHFQYRLGRFDPLMTHGPLAADVLCASDQAEAACAVLRWVSLGGAEIGDFVSGIAAAQRGLELAERCHAMAAHVLLTNALAASFERMGDPWQAERLMRQALVAAQADGGDIPRFVTLNNLGAVALTRFYLLRDGGRAEEAVAVLRQARDELTQALPLAEHIGDPFYAVYIEANVGDILNFLGEHDAAQRHLQRALALAQAQRFDTLVPRVLCSLGELELECGRPQQARDLLAPLARSVDRDVPVRTVLRTHHALYRALRRLGDAEAALLSLERCHALERQRVLDQLRAQAQHLVTRAEIERAYRDARYHSERAASLAEVAHRDVLTGLANRRGLEQRLRALERSAQLPLAVALIDLDKLKPINDRHGHASGDDALVRVARLLDKELRQQDIVARIGGDEFALVLPDLDIARATAVAERIREAAKRADDAQAVPLSVTVGLVTMDAWWDGEQPLGEWLADADAALYEGKRLGGDRVVVRRR